MLALQETKLPKDIKYEPKKYHAFCKNRDRNGGGVAILVNKNVPCTQIILKMSYQEQSITVCSLYLPQMAIFQ